jgi:methyl-accepting chemotaxis protein
MTRVRGWLGVLRGLGTDTSAEAQELVEAETQLWAAHSNATTAAIQVVEATGMLAAASTRQRKQVDALLETARSTRARTEDMGPAIALVSEALERLRLVALNLGLEGSRMGDAAGRALALVSDEVRAYMERGSDALRDVQSLVEEVRPSIRQLADQADQLRQGEADLANDVARLQSLAQDTARSVEDISVWARKLAETDPETATILARASDHARALVADLSQLKSASQGELARAVLRPLVEPLARLVKDLGSDAE